MLGRSAVAEERDGLEALVGVRRAEQLASVVLIAYELNVGHKRTTVHGYDRRLDGRHVARAQRVAVEFEKGGARDRRFEAGHVRVMFIHI